MKTYYISNKWSLLIATALIIALSSCTKLEDEHIEEQKQNEITTTITPRGQPSIAPTPSPALTEFGFNLAFNNDPHIYPSPEMSDEGWLQWNNKWEILDGKRTGNPKLYGLAFHQKIGVKRQVTIPYRTWL